MSQGIAIPNATHDEASLWLPPRRLVRYQFAKVGGALIAAGIFAGWLVIQWSNWSMRLLAGALLVMTAWITFSSIVGDLVRSRGRQLAVVDAALRITTPSGETLVPAARVAWAQWRNDTEATMGLWLFDAGGAVLAHLDAGFIATDEEARAFLHWVRQRTAFTSDVRWPSTA